MVENDETFDESRSIFERILNIILILITIFCTGFIVVITIFKLFYIIIRLILNYLTEKENPKFCTKCKVYLGHAYSPKSHIELEGIFKSHQFNQIPFEQLKKPEFITNGGFSRIYKAVWYDRPRLILENGTRSRLLSGRGVAIKYISDPSNIINEFHAHIRCIKSNSIIPLLGVSKDINTNEFMLVMRYAQKGNLREYLSNHPNLSWRKKTEIILDIATGLADIHRVGLIHADFHSGNVLISAGGKALISDLGLSRLKSSTSHLKTKALYGVIQYIAPELIRCQTSYTQEADVYSFGIVVWEVCSGLRVYDDRSCDISLILEICNKELRPNIHFETPDFFVSLMKLCWHNDRLKRPSMNFVLKDLRNFYIYSDFDKFDQEMPGNLLRNEIIDIGRPDTTIEDDYRYNTRITDLTI